MWAVAAFSPLLAVFGLDVPDFVLAVLDGADLPPDFVALADLVLDRPSFETAAF